MNIAIDGPAGAGKSTIAKKIAAKLGIIYVDTGAMYRALALFFLRQGIKDNENELIEDSLKDVDVTIEFNNNEQVVLLNGENVNSLIRSEEVGNMASATSVNGKVREKMVSLQQRLAANRDVIMDGRDIGTVVLPNAEVKIYLTASSEVRARRRLNQLKKLGQDGDLAQIEKDIIERDERDMNREISPLMAASDAIIVDSSDMDLEQVINRCLEIINGN